MKDIRASSKNVWKWLAKLGPQIGLKPYQMPVPVTGVKEAKDKVRRMQDKVEKRKQRKEERARAQDTAVQVAQAPTATRTQTGPGPMVCPRPPPDNDSPESQNSKDNRQTRSNEVTSERGRRPTPKRLPTAAPPAPRDAQADEKPEEASAREPSDSSSSDQIVTPRASNGSHAHLQARWADSHSIPTRLMSDREMTDDVARQFADLLGSFQRTRFAHKRPSDSPVTLEEPDSSSLRVESPIPPELPYTRREQGEEQSSEDVSVSSEESDDDDGGRTEDDEGSIEAVTWATGDLNIDADTKALWSGGGTDTPMSP